MQIVYLLLLGAIAGVLSGFLGIGGGVVIIPALIYIFGLTQHQAQGTTLALMVPPIGLLAAMSYYKTGNVKISMAAFICIGFFLGIAAYQLKLDDIASEIDKRTSADYGMESIGYLAIATSVRNQQYDTALKFTEDRLASSVNSLTQNGVKIDSLSTFDKKALEKVRIYRAKDCGNDCLPGLAWMENRIAE